MKLNRVEIKNFRSISNITIDMLHGCEIILGLNESGKSNILEALSLLDQAKSPNPSDIRNPHPNEAPINDSYVRFVFKLAPSEAGEVYEVISKRFRPEDLAKPIATHNGKLLTLRDFVLLRDEVLYQVEIASGSRKNSYFGVTKAFSMVSNWNLISDSKVDMELVDKNGVTLIIPAEVDFYYDEEYTAATGSVVKPFINIEALNQIVAAEGMKYLTRNLPPCVYWKYDQANLLPSAIDVNVFMSNPNMCIPLRSMFELAGYNDIQKILTAERSRNAQAYKNLLKQVASKATEHLRSVWKDYANVEITLSRNGDLIEPTIKEDELELDVSSRSEGFKRFISFILLVSAKVKNGFIKDSLLLIDEPETSLHPSGARNLMHELIAIGKRNYVVYSTHSIFMIDKDNIERHYIVKKSRDATNISRVDRSKIVDEDILYQAVGYSIFETLKNKNIIFEGWRDKQLFKASLIGWRDKVPDFDAKFSDIGTTFAQGVKDVKHVSKFLELASRGCLIISDADDVGLNWKKEYVDSNGYGTWVSYRDITEDGRFVTAEDFLLDDHIVERSNSFADGHAGLPSINIEQIHGISPKINFLKSWIAEVFPERLAREQALNELKTSLFQQVTADKLAPEYLKVLQFVSGFDFFKN